MSLETVVEDIRNEARERAEEIRAEGETRADEIIAEAESDAEEILAAKEREIESQIEREREQKLSSAKLEAKQKRLEARRDVLQDVRSDVEEEIATLGGDDREELTRTLLDAAAEEFDSGNTVRIYGRADDEELLTDVVTDYDGFEYAGEYDCLGGIVAESEASRVRVNNTFDSILEDVWEDNLQAISSRLFEQ
ncbi:V/A-type H+-transporting ATPase subunit E [Haladaptatus litoreus]|uniref:A-type ATP synthase subunit E n=1 Tax=Haladaptatus litoreus TaxID=553468 RepID=A0A1N7BUM7_9EURY|nr:V-type ATP synthase subunit E [Haladaptatus litoreus]SIR55010.1 V/A-type H+-transporting ATPase subunit E [Haladaptatus litoreus]